MNSLPRHRIGLWGLLVVCLAIASSQVPRRRTGGRQPRRGLKNIVRRTRKSRLLMPRANRSRERTCRSNKPITHFSSAATCSFGGMRASNGMRIATDKQFAALFNYATLPFYWPNYERRRGEPGHEGAEQVARWCREHHIATKGHPLAWNFAEPRWLPDDLDEVRRLQYGRVDDCVSRFHGLIDRWDVVNEAIDFERDEFWRRAPKMTAMWEKTGRIEFVFACFAAARRANPQATLLINDYRTDAAYQRLLDQLVDDQGQRVYDVIGIQSHMHGGTWDNGRIWDVCERFSRYGVPLHFTETTVLSDEPGGRRRGRERRRTTTEEGERWQADEVERFYTMLFSHPAVTAITWWDLADRGGVAGCSRRASAERSVAETGVRAARRPGERSLVDAGLAAYQRARQHCLSRLLRPVSGHRDKRGR